MANRTISWAWLVIVLLGLFVGVLLYRSTQRSVLDVRTARAERQDLHAGVVTNGRAEPTVRQDLRAEADGEIVRVEIREGDAVRKGQTLLEISPTRARNELEQARAILAEAESQLRLLRQGGTAQEIQELQSQRTIVQRERDEAAQSVAQNERLAEKGAIPRLELDESRQRLAKAEADFSLVEQKLSERYGPEEIAQAEAKVEAARAAVRLAELRLQSTTVAAPLEGEVYSLPVRVGDYVRSGDLLARVGSLDRIRVRVFVDEPDLGRIQSRQPVRVSWDGLPGKEWQGEVERLPSEIVELGTRRVGEVTCTLDNLRRELLPNMNLNIEIVTESRSAALSVPREAVLGGGSDRYVFVLRDGVLERRSVRAGILSPTRVEIQDGLQEGDTVALAGEQPLEEGMRVRANSQ